MPKNYRAILPGVYRSASLHNLSKRQVDSIRKDGIRCIIDLRTSQEREEKPDTVIGGIEYIHLPIFSEATLGVTKELGTDPGEAIKKVKDKKELRAIIPDISEIYRRMVSDEYSRGQILKVLRVIHLNRENGIPTLFHCTVGKDRTGIISAILLKMEGFSDKEIFRDYQRTNRVMYTEAISKALLVLVFKQDFISAKKVFKSFWAAKEYLLASYDQMAKDEGSVANFIQKMFRDI